LDHRTTPEQATERYPFLLITGRSLYQFNAGTMTGRTRNNELRSSDVLDISPADAMAQGISDGERVRVESRHGAAVLPVRLTGSVREGQLFATFQTKEIFLNVVTGPHRDRDVATPEYKVTAVRIERVIPDRQAVARERS
jgi:formate dehydrogenase major subunit